MLASEVNTHMECEFDVAAHYPIKLMFTFAGSSEGDTFSDMKI